MNIEKYEEQMAKAGYAIRRHIAWQYLEDEEQKDWIQIAREMLNVLPIKEILESCQYDKGYEAALARKVKGITVGELVEKAEEGKLVELDEDQTFPQPKDKSCTTSLWYQKQLWAEGWRRLASGE